MFTYNLRALKAEWLKLKRTGIFWICFSAALFFPLLFTITFMFMDLPSSANEEGVWNQLITTYFSSFAGFFFPIFLVIIVARNVYFEHRYDTWKLLETQPVPKAALYIAKWQIMLLISFCILIALALFTLAGGFILQLFKPEPGLKKASIDWGILGAVLFRYWIASFGIITIQYFIGIWNKSFALPLIIGLVGVIAGSILAGFGIFTWWPYSATSLTSSSFSGSLTGNYLMHHEKMSLLWTAMFLLFGYLLYTNRGFVAGLLAPVKRLALTIAVLAAFVAIAWLVNRPVALLSYGKTVIAGKIEADKPIAFITIIKAPAYDTVCHIPVVNGRFHFAPKQKIEPAIYMVKAGVNSLQLYFGTDDSIYINWQIKKQYNNADISGTRIAENAFLKKKGGNDLYYLSNYAHEFKPEDYAKEIIKKWDDGVKDIRKFQTADNIKPAPKFVEVQEKLLAIKLLRLAEVVYPQVYAMYYPNEKFKLPSQLKKLKESADLEDKELAGYSELTTFLSELYRSKTGKNDSAYFAVINQQVKQQKLKDVLFYDAINSTLLKIKDSARRNAYLAYFTAFVSDANLKLNLHQTNERLKSLNRGNKAHIFAGEALNGNEIVLTQLANRYVVIDVWATWCGPCKSESPYFEELAEKYTNQNVAFVAVSIDETKGPWKMEAPQKSKRVLQLWAKNPNEDFMKQYGVSSIPRFMLIDPRGYIINANMPAPSDPEFENTLLKEIPGLRGYASN